MNIPHSTIEPFGYTGLPRIYYSVPKSHYPTLNKIVKDIAWWCRTFTTPLSIGEQLLLQNRAKELGASYANVRAHDNRDGGYTFTIILNGLDYPLEINP